MARRYALLLIIAIAVIAVACGEDETSGLLLDLQQDNWNSANVTWTVAGTEAKLTDVEIVFLDSTFDTLYAGADTDLSIPDAQLGNNERLLVEVCGTLDGEELCAQQGLRASPKKFAVGGADIRYPADPGFTTGRWTADLAVEREQFNQEDSWEILPGASNPETNLVATVGRLDQAVSTPTSRGSATFDLSRHANFGDFEYEMRSAMYGGRSAEVHLQLVARWNGLEEIISEERVVLSQPSEQERQDDINFFAQQAANQMIQELFGERELAESARVQVESWEYNRFEDKYRADLEVRWRDRQRRGRSSQHVLRGTLSASQNGSNARFEADRATRDVRSAWLGRVDEGSALRIQGLRTNLKRETMNLTDEQLAADSLLPAIALN